MAENNDTMPSNDIFNDSEPANDNDTQSNDDSTNNDNDSSYNEDSNEITMASDNLTQDLDDAVANLRKEEKEKAEKEKESNKTIDDPNATDDNEQEGDNNDENTDDSNKEPDLPEELQESDESITNLYNKLDEDGKKAYLEQVKEFNSLTTAKEEAESNLENYKMENSPYTLVEKNIKETFGDVAKNWSSDAIAITMNDAFNTYKSIAQNPLQGAIQALYDISAVHTAQRAKSGQEPVNYVQQLAEMIRNSAEDEDAFAKLQELDTQAQVAYQAYNANRQTRNSEFSNSIQQHRDTQFNKWTTDTKHGQMYKTMYNDPQWNKVLKAQFKAAVEMGLTTDNIELHKQAVEAALRVTNNEHRIKALNSKDKPQSKQTKKSTEDFNKTRNRTSTKKPPSKSSGSGKVPKNMTLEEATAYFEKNPNAKF